MSAFNRLGALVLLLILAVPARAQQPTIGTNRVNPRDGAEMVYVSAGEFIMGENDPPHKVTLDDFWIYKNDLTVEQYKAFCQATDRKMPIPPPWGWQDTHPMVDVSWDDAEAYSQWAHTALPTEAQWEKAARGTDGLAYPWGNDFDYTKLWFAQGTTAPVGSFPAGASPYGCLDMEGNVSQWCADWYDADYYRDAPDHNPTGPAIGTTRVLRGLSFIFSSPDCFRSSGRFGIAPSSIFSNIGFRCVQSGQFNEPNPFYYRNS